MPKHNPKKKKKSSAQKRGGKKAPRYLENIRNITGTYNAIKKEEEELAKQGKKLPKEKQKFIDEIDEAVPEIAEKAINILTDEKGRERGRFAFFLKRKKKKDLGEGE